jgi:putative tricarboxylic transport membrane protein
MLRKYDFFPGTVFSLIAIYVVWKSYKLGLGSFRTPGVGLVPFLIGILFFIMAITIVICSHNVRQAFQAIRDVWKEVAVKKLVLVLILLLGYAFFLERLGYILTTMLFFFVVFKTIGEVRLRVNLLVTISSVLISYLLFVVILEVQLPSGFVRDLVAWMF